MRVYATATKSSRSNAVGQIELECTLNGLVVGLFGVGAYSDGYAPGALASGTRLVLPWSSVKSARVAPEAVDLELDAPGFPHDRLTLTRFSAGPGVPWTELRKRRLLLHVAALSVAAAAAGISAVLAPRDTSGAFGFGALGYGIVSASLVLAFGYSLDQRFFLRPPGEEESRAAFLRDLERFFPELERVGELPNETKPFELPNLAGFLPRTTIVIGVTLAASVLTALVTGQRLLGSERAATERASLDEVTVDAEKDESEELDEHGLGRKVYQGANARSAEETAETTPAVGDSTFVAPPTPDDAVKIGAAADGDVSVERRCLCDRADSPLWQKPIPRLTTLLLEKRIVPTKTSARTELEVAVINNGDEPVNEITLQVQFFEMVGKKREPTKNRPLYFEGPLGPGQAIKWSTDARGTEFEITSPDVGALGANGEGAAPNDAFFQLLSARNRPVRLHAVRMLGYLGDARARDAALGLKDALRSAEAPYLRRVLAALHDVRTCDVEVKPSGSSVTLGACVFNASDAAQENLGLQVQALSQPLDPSQPLAHPPEQRAEKKWSVKGPIEAQAGQYVRITLPSEIAADKAATLEVLADRLDLLE